MLWMDLEKKRRMRKVCMHAFDPGVDAFVRAHVSVL